MNMQYYSINFNINKDGVVGNVVKMGNETDMLRQYYLFCANSATNADGDQFDAVEFGTFEGGKLKREVFDRRAAV